MNVSEDIIKGIPVRSISAFVDISLFFDLFVDFKGYVDFFHLQDLVTENYSAVEFLCWFDGFHSNYPLPRTVEEYNEYINRVMKFSKSRNERIATWCRENSRLL